MRRILYSVFGVSVLIGIVGSRWRTYWEYTFGGPSGLMADVVSALQAFDRWLIDLGMFPTFIAIGVIGIVLTYEWPRIWAHFRKYKQNVEKFQREFDMTAAERVYLRRCMASLYDIHRSDDMPTKFPDFAARATIPDSLPLKDGESLYDWTQSAAAGRMDTDSHGLYGYALRVYVPGEVGCKDDRVDTARQTAAKFWNSWGLKIDNGSLRETDIANQLRSNAIDLTILVFLEIAYTRQSSWDTGPGKSGLFSLAKKAQGV